MDTKNGIPAVEDGADVGGSDAPQYEVSRTPVTWRSVMRWMVVGNPFYPLSAVLVLLGVFLLSGEERMFGAELTQLYFNFGSIEFYGLLVATTAVYLFRCQVYYDTLMLVVLATVPLLVPFILISQAALLGNGTMSLLCGLAAVFGLLQWCILRRGVFEIPFKKGMSVFVFVVLGLNLVMPVGLKTLHAEVNAIVWAVRLDQAGLWSWNVFLPLLVVTAFFIAPLDRRRFGDCHVGWLPSVMILLLVAGTTLHLCSLGYVYTFPFDSTYLIPVTWMGTWLIWWRRDEWVDERWRGAARYSIFLPYLFSVLAITMSGNTSLFVVTVVNLCVAIGMLMRRNHRTDLKVAGAVSVLGMLNSVPTTWLIGWIPDTTHVQLMWLVGSTGVLVMSLFRRAPGWGIAAALATIFPLSHLWLTQSSDWPVVGQFALVVFWVHSQRWEDLNRHSLILQGSLFAVWCLHSAVWFLLNQGQGRVDLLFFASVFAATSGVSLWIRAGLRYWFYGGISLLMTGLGGIDEIVAVVSEIPFGALALAGGLILFALGTLLAKWRHRILGARFDSPIV